MTLLRILPFFAFSAILFAQAGSQDYGGPSVLSRGLSSSVSNGGSTSLRPYVGVSGFCDSALAPASVNVTGHLVKGGTGCGVEGDLGIFGGHDWKNTRVGLDYNGHYRHYTNNSYYDGTDQFLSLGITHRVTKRMQLTLRESAGTYSRNYSAPSASGFIDPYAIVGPTSELLDNRVFFLSTAADMTYQRSARLSVDFGGSGYLVRRRSSSLFAVTGAQARADVAYRYSRFGTIGATYDFTHMDFTKAFGAIDAHSAGIIYSLRLSASWELAATVGASRIESLALTVIAVDPVIAAITGQTGAVGVSYRTTYQPMLRGRLVHHFRRASFDVNYARIVSPGNGLYAGVSQESAGVTYSYSGIRHWNFGVSGGYAKLVPLQQAIGTYRNFQGGAGITRDLFKGVNAVLRFDDRRDLVQQSSYRRTSYRATLGLTWSPGEIPLALW